MSELSPIARYCERSGLRWNSKRAERMSRYLDLLVEFNDSMNIIGPMERSTIVVELLRDSLAAAVARRPRGPILDVGTGAGLPGIPVKIVFPECPLTLVEPRRKRSTFLKIAVHRLDLDDVDVVRSRIQEFDQRHFNWVISKAFQPPTIWLDTAAPYIDDDGAVICMARDNDRDELIDAARSLGLSLVGQSSADADDSPQRRVCYAFE